MKLATDYKITRLRCLAIVIVVLGHSIILYDPQWGLYQTSHTVDLLMWIKRIINAFQMPLFLFLSGYCFLQIPVDWCVHSRISGAPILK